MGARRSTAVLCTAVAQSAPPQHPLHNLPHTASTHSVTDTTEPHAPNGLPPNNTLSGDTPGVCSPCRTSCPAGQRLKGHCTLQSNPFCDGCKPGTFKSHDGPHGCSTCTVCHPGTEAIGQCSTTTDTRCEACHVGYYSTGGGVACQPCETGCSRGWSLDSAPCNLTHGPTCMLNGGARAGVVPGSCLHKSDASFMIHTHSYLKHLRIHPRTRLPSNLSRAHSYCCTHTFMNRCTHIGTHTRMHTHVHIHSLHYARRMCHCQSYWTSTLGD